MTTRNEDGLTSTKCSTRKFTVVYVDSLVNGDRTDDGVSEMTVEEILDDVNDGHSDEFTDYDETDWIEGLLNFTDNDLILNKGDKMFWTDPDDGACSCEVTVEETVRLTGGFGVETSTVVCSNGEHNANELS
jgi:hypothetical protein